MSKPYTLILAELHEGKVAAALTNDLQELLAAVQQSGRSGDITLKLKVAPAVKGSRDGVDKVTVTAERKLNLPKPDAPTDFFYMTDDAQLSRQHPKQQELQLRDVAAQPVLSNDQIKKVS